jgi:hypothetical protein
MKQICTLLIIICSFFLNAPAQNFVSENNLWSIVITNSGTDQYNRSIYYKFLGDSTINQTTYEKLYSTKDEQMEEWGFNSLWYEQNDSIFKYDENSQQNLLTYDFNIEEKDSFYYSTAEMYMYVDSTNTTIWGGEERKHIYLSTPEIPGLQTIWRQGVGQDGLIIRSSEAFIVGAFAKILCFTENNELVYQNPDFNTCYINTTDVTTIEDQAKLIEVFPCDIGTLTIRMSSQQQGEFMLFDLEGRKILNQDINDTETQLCLPQSGIFIYRFTSNEGEIQTGKVYVN